MSRSGLGRITYLAVFVVIVIVIGAIVGTYALGSSKEPSGTTTRTSSATASTAQEFSTTSTQSSSTSLVQISSTLQRITTSVLIGQSSTIGSTQSQTTTKSAAQEIVNLSTIEPTAPIFSQNGWFNYYLYDPNVPAPVGIASYGLYNQSGNLEGYTISSSEIVAKAEISSLAAFNATLPNSLSFNITYANVEYGANLQLNAMVLVNTTAGTQIYWVQNTNRFDTLDRYVNSPRDLIFNLTAPSNSIVVKSGNGSVGSGKGASYSYGLKFAPYSLPLALNLSISTRVISGAGVQISFSNYPFGKGLFDQVILPVPNAISAKITVTPYQSAGDIPIDAELVWTGFCCGYGTNYTAMNSTISLYFLNTLGYLQLYPSFYTFGSATAETSTSLRVAPTTAGGEISIGSNYDGFLENLS